MENDDDIIDEDFDDGPYPTDLRTWMADNGKRSPGCSWNSVEVNEE